MSRPGLTKLPPDQLWRQGLRFPLEVDVILDDYPILYISLHAGNVKRVKQTSYNSEVLIYD
jgi:hypothetical protein